MIKILFQTLINLIFPKYCYSCFKIGQYICKKCLKEKIYFNSVQICHICGKESRVGMVHSDCRESSFLDGLIFVTLYDEVIERMMWDVKYKYYFEVLTDISKIMVDYLRFYKFSQKFILTEVPMHPKKKSIRGFNQAEVLARNISKSLGYEYYEILKRVKFTHAQVGLDKDHRETNLKSAFQLNKFSDDLKSKDILIIDDVFTTGTTLNECARVLKSEGFSRVYGFVFARAGLAN